jgi:transposase-like protein
MLTRMGLRMSADEWAELVRAWEESGHAAAAFAADHGIAEASLRWWKTELARRARKQAARKSPGPRRPATVAVARVVREGDVVDRAPARATGAVSVVVGGARVVVEAGFDRKLLRDVVEALGGPR